MTTAPQEAASGTALPAEIVAAIDAFEIYATRVGRDAYRAELVAAVLAWGTERERIGFKSALEKVDDHY